MIIRINMILDFLVGEELRHADENFSSTRKLRTPVCRHHIVQQQDVALFPRKADCFLLVGVPNLVKHRNIDVRAIRVISISR